MSNPRDDWDAEERDALDGLEGELAELRRKHQDDPSLAMLRAANADALPPELRVQVERHLEESAWSRAVIDGLRDTGVEDRLDARSEDRLFTRITREARAASLTSSRRLWPSIAMGGFALAATLLMAVMVSRSGRDTVVVPDDAPATTDTPAAPIKIAYFKPEVKLSPSALTWRGDPTANPFLRDLAPAFEAYRAGDHPRAVTEFDRIAAVYPDAIEVLFYQGVSRMLAGNDAGAVAPLEAAARLRDATFADDVLWFLAVAQQRSGNPNARTRFEELCRGKSTYQTAACTAAAQLAATPASPQP